AGAGAVLHRPHARPQMGAAMSAGLLRKELREQRPFVLLVAFLVVLDLVYWMLQQFDMQALGLTIEELGTELAALLFFIAFAMGTGLLIREIDDRTLSFLDGLPLSRLRVFAVKVALASGVLLAYPLACVILRIAQHLVARQSLDHALHAPLLGQARSEEPRVGKEGRSRRSTAPATKAAATSSSTR